MAADRPKAPIARTPDGLKFEVEISGDESFYRASSAGRGALIRVDEGIGKAIAAIAEEIGLALRMSRGAGASDITAEFGIALDPDAGFVVTQGRDKSSITITLEFHARDIPQFHGGNPLDA